MPKTPDEIKKGLRCLSHDRTHTLPCSDCEYHGQGLPPCRMAVHEDAIALIQQLQAENAEKDARIQQLEKRVIHLEALNQSNLSVITMQERTRDRLQEQISQLEAERDAAVRDMQEFAQCGHCKHQNKNLVKCNEFDFFCDKCDAVGCECVSCDEMEHQNWEWRGVQKEETP